MDELLLDTTYLLPAVGVDIQLGGFGTDFPKMLERFRVFFNPVSLIEAKWIILKACRRERSAEARRRLLERYRTGISALLRDSRLEQTALTSPAVEQVADTVLVEDGLDDYFDRMIYATACERRSVLLTEDRELKKLEPTKSGAKPKNVVRWATVKMTAA